MLVVPLREAHDRRQVGGKAAQLGNLLRHGLRVPDGFCVPTSTVADLHRPDVISAITGSLDVLEAERVAVRSSAVDEDGVADSYAGIFCSVLRVPATPESVLDALATVARSLDSPAAVAYRSRRGIPRRPIAALVQRMIDPAYAGVLFTRDPVTGEEHYVIEYTQGLGDRVVHGSVTPEYFAMTPTGELVEDGPGCPGSQDRAAASSVPQAVRRGLAAVGRQCEQLAGGPQDVEWAVADGEIWILQCRPISA